MSNKMSPKVPQVVGKEFELTQELIEGFGKDGEGEMGKE
jgi:hypothetical protein